MIFIEDRISITHYSSLTGQDQKLLIVAADAIRHFLSCPSWPPTKRFTRARSRICARSAVVHSAFHGISIDTCECMTTPIATDTFCDDCGFGCQVRARLRKHLLTHTQPIPFGCAICPRGSASGTTTTAIRELYTALQRRTPLSRTSCSVPAARPHTETSSSVSRVFIATTCN